MASPNPFLDPSTQTPANGWAPGTPQASGITPAFIPGGNAFTNTAPGASTGPNAPGLSTPSSANPTIPGTGSSVFGQLTAGQLAQQNSAPGSPNATAYANYQQNQQPQAQSQQPITNGGYNNIPGLFQSLLTQLPSFAPTAQTTQFGQQLQQAIMNQIQQNSQPVTAQDPLIAPVIQSLRDQAQRGMEQNQQLVGERLYGQGVPASSGAWDSAVQGYNQGANQGTQAQIASTMLNQVQLRQQAIASALSQGSQYLTSAQTLQLQQQLAQMASAQNLLQTILGNSQFYNSLGTQASMFQQNQNNLAAGA